MNGRHIGLSLTGIVALVFIAGLVLAIAKLR